MENCYCCCKKCGCQGYERNMVKNEKTEIVNETNFIFLHCPVCNLNFREYKRADY